MTAIDAAWLQAVPVQRLFDLFEGAGHRLFVVGGCVRNTLMERAVSDIDMATDATPDQVLVLAEEADIRAVPTGMAHGTITLVIAGTGYEVTTFRDDVETDGRHAVVRFSREIATDAHRRDFTMNALYADRDGKIIDLVDGLQDIAARRVRFIGTASDRLREDYLRALRYFRFFAWYGDPESGVDPEAMSAIACELDGMASLSVERITAEMTKLLTAPDPAPAVAAMGHVGLLKELFDGGDPATLARLCHFEGDLGLAPDPVLRLAALALPAPTERLRLSRAQVRALTTLRDNLETLATPAALGYHLGAARARQVLALRCAVFEQSPGADDMRDVQRGAQASFPLKAADLMPGLEGPALGAALIRLEADWIASGFTLTRTELLARL